MKVAAEAALASQRSVKSTVTATATTEVERTQVIDVPPGENRPLRVYASYFQVEFDVYLSHLDYLILDYSTGRGQVLPPNDQASRMFRRRFGASPTGRSLNEIGFFAKVGTVQFHQKTPTETVLFATPKGAVINPEELTVVGDWMPMARWSISRPVSLYEAARSRKLPKTRAAARAALNL